MLAHGSHPIGMSTGVHAAGAVGFEQGGGIIVLQVRVTDRFGEEAGAAAKDEVWGVRQFRRKSRRCGYSDFDILCGEECSFKSRCEDEKRPVHKVYWSFLVGAAGFEPTASSSRTRRATICAMPRKYRSRLGCGLVGDERIELPQVESESTALPLCKSPLFGLSGAARRC